MKIDPMQLNIFGEAEVLKTDEGKKEEVSPNTKTSENGKKAKARSQKPLTPVNPAGEELPPDRDRLVCYAGHQILITDRSLTLEQIRQQLERDFPELSAERVMWHWVKPDDDKNQTEEPSGPAAKNNNENNQEGNTEQQKKPIVIVPVVTAGKKGLGEISQALRGYYWTVRDMLAEPRPINYLTARDGVYEVRKTPAGLFSRKIGDNLNGLVGPDEWREGVILSCPKIPLMALKRAIDMFRKFCPYEVMVNICWGKTGYCVIVPEQEITRVSILYKKKTFLPRDETIPVLELHSHGRSKAFFSEADDKDEVATGLYGVVGHVDTENPEVLLRYSCGGVYKNISPEQIFEEWAE